MARPPTNDHKKYSRQSAKSQSNSQVVVASSQHNGIVGGSGSGSSNLHHNKLVGGSMNQGISSQSRIKKNSAIERSSSSMAGGSNVPTSTSKLGHSKVS